MTITSGQQVIQLWIGKPITVPPGRTMLPLRFISETLGCQVEWNQTLREATVRY
ncbi:MAG: hypothetical protein KGZ96_08350 [Clostridia bacterium]|nr:hypothetical protein [Clostridia bacterium]